MSVIDIRPYLGPAYTDREISPSQLDTYDTCERKWAWKRIGKIEAPPHASAALGTDSHSQLENHLRGGEIDFTRPSGAIVASGLEHLPAPLTPGMELESPFRIQDPETGVIFGGFRDVYIPAFFREGNASLVLDHKTTSNINRYAKTADDLRKDYQGVIYAASAFTGPAIPDAVDLNWVYYQTQGTSKSTKVHLRVLPDEEFAQHWNRVRAKADHVTSLYRRDQRPRGSAPAAKGDAVSNYITNTYLPNADACQAYGGCPYLDRCDDVNTVDRLFGGGSSMDIDALLSSLASKAPTPAPSAAVDPINPPERSPEPAPPQKPTVEAKAEAVASESKSTDPEIDAILKRTPTDAQVAETPKRGRGRPKKEASAPAASEFTPTPDYSAHEEAQEEASQGGKPIGFLFVNCLPIGFRAVSLERAVLESAREAVRIANGVNDYREIEYGKGPAALIAAARAAIEGKTYSGVLVDTSTPEGRDLLSTLTSLSNVVVRGF